MRRLLVAPLLLGMGLHGGESVAADATTKPAPIRVGNASAPGPPPPPSSPPPPVSEIERAGGAAAPESGSPAPPPPSGPPPPYYVEAQSGVGHGAPPEMTYEPPPPRYEPPPPEETHSRAPRTSLWLGVRAGLFVPFGSLWLDGFDGDTGFGYRRRTFASYAGPGPALELNAGARLSRRYLIFAIFEHASLGAGGLDAKAFGSQERGATNFYGAGVRFSTDPAAVGFAMEVALGYRDFRAYWADGSKLSMTNGFIDVRVGVGLDIRVNGRLSLSPMMVLGGGSFGDAKWSDSTGSRAARTPLDEVGQYGTLALQLGGHVDVF